MSEEKLTAAVIEEITNKLSVLRDPKNFDTQRPFVALPTGYSVHNLTNYIDYLESRNPAPNAVRKSMTFVDVESFITYFNEFKQGNLPHLFSTIETNGLRILCVFDYDEAEADGTKARWNRDRAYLQLAYARDYRQLREKADKWFSQEEFALFVEENTHLFTEPDGATMLELAQNLKGARNVIWQSGKSLHNGSVQIEYVETIDAHTKAGAIKVPERLVMRMPMYEGFEDTNVNAAFRWKLGEGKKVEFSYRLLTKLAEREAEDEVKQTLVAKTGLPLLSVVSFAGITATS